MLTVENIDLLLRRRPGAARRLARPPRPGRSPACWAATASARPRCCAPSSGQQARPRGRDRSGTAQDLTRARRPTSARGSASRYVPQGREIFPLLTVEENLETGFAPLRARPAHHSGRGVRAVPGARADAAPARRRPLRRPAAAARHRPRAGHAPEAAGARRADRGHPALDHQGHRPRHRPICASSGEMAIVLVEQYFDFAQRARRPDLRSWTAARSCSPATRRRSMSRPCGGI